MNIHKTVTFLEFRKNLSEYVNLAKYKSERFLITRNGKVAGAFVLRKKKNHNIF